MGQGRPPDLLHNDSFIVIFVAADCDACTIEQVFPFALDYATRRL